MRKTGITIVVFAVVMSAVFGAATLVSDDVALPQPITESSPCPAVGCVAESCHGFDNVPTPDGANEMTCPEAGCASVECHAWDTLTTRYYQASDASLNLWVLAPVVLIVGLILLVRKL